MTNIEFFTKVNERIDPNAEEVTIVGSRVEENLFDSKNVPPEYLARFLDEMIVGFGEPIDVEKLQQFSFQAADGVAYTEHKFMAVFSGGKCDCFHTDVDVTNPHDDYCVNFFVESGTRIPKFYDLEIDRHEQPLLPIEARLITHWGQGVSENPGVKDVYFLYRDVSFVAHFLGMPAPYLTEIKSLVEDTTFDKVFGLTYNTRTLEPLKLKLYYYPGDPNMEHTVFDEVRDDQSS